MKILKIIFLLLITISMIQCTNELENPVPSILSITPDSKVAHLPEFTMTVIKYAVGNLLNMEHVYSSSSGNVPGNISITVHHSSPPAITAITR